MRSKGIVRGEFFGNHKGGLFTKTLLSINRGEFSKFGVRKLLQCFGFSCDVGPFRVGLRRNGYIFARSHRHCTRREPRYARDNDCAWVRIGRSHTYDQGGDGNDPVIRAKDGSA